MAIRTLLLDLGNVLLYFSHEQMCAQIAEACQAPVTAIRELLFAGGLQRRFERGELSEGDFHRAVEAAIGRPVELARLRRAGADIFRPNEALLALVDQWKRDGYRLVLLSNTCVTHYDFICEHFDVLERFDALVLSYRVGAAKPENAIYEAALEKIACAPDECFYTDDIPDYVDRARSFGLQAEVFIDVPILVRQLEVRGVSCRAFRAAF